MNELEKAIDLVEQNWCAGSLIEDGKVCAAGAIYAAHKGYSAGHLKRLTFDETIDFENKAARYTNDSEAGKALAAEIIEQGLHKAGGDNTEPYFVIWGFNDFDDDSASGEDKRQDPTEVIEVMKHAAKRL